jgi:preprotein translocase subunit SecA
MFRFLGKFLDSNKREIDRLQPQVEKINSLEEKVKKLKKREFKKKTEALKKRLSQGETLDNLLPEAFALVREASVRTIGLRPYDVQLIAAISFHQGKIAEQKTGEGKTLSAVPALYLNALAGKGTHLVTVNDYLARRDTGWMGPIFHLLGLSVGCIIHEKSFLYDPQYLEKGHDDERLAHLRLVSRKEAYQADVTYGTNNEFGFDYLRDNMVHKLEDMSQRGHHFAIVDEVDFILIDEARTPLIISTPDVEPTKKYYQFSGLIKNLSADTDYIIDEKLKTANLTDHGLRKVEKTLGVDNLYEKDFDAIHHIEQALRAKTLFRRDKDYVVKDNQVIIVDEFTGRLMHGRRYSEGLHQAIEAKEGVTIQQESKTLATISFQNYFRMYEKLAGMTGTAATESEEFKTIYNLEVVVVPTHKPMIRKDNADVVYKTVRAKYAAVVKEVKECYERGQPVLIGTTSIEKNEIIDDFLKHKKIPHNVLNAKNHEKEASVIAQAGQVAAVTVATNMAGRGVDIVLGGDPANRDKKDWQKEHEQVIKLGGLHVIGTERHEARRIDNQLRGRSGRQGDPGSSRFFVSLEDDIMRLFGGEQVAKMMTTFKMPENVPLEHSMVTKAIEQAQVKVEGFHFEARKRLVEYDDVMNKQRELVYQMRRKVLEKPEVLTKVHQEVTGLVKAHVSDELGTLNHEAIIKDLSTIIPFDEKSRDNLKSHLANLKSGEEIGKFLLGVLDRIYQERKKQLGSKMMQEVEKWVSLNVIDYFWMEHLDATDDLREGISLRGYAQRDPLVEYKAETYQMFERLTANINAEIVRRIFRVKVAQEPTQSVDVQLGRGTMLGTDKPDDAGGSSVVRPVISGKKKIGRNDPCWCGSGKKWKHCHYPELPSSS